MKRAVLALGLAFAMGAPAPARAGPPPVLSPDGPAAVRTLTSGDTATLSPGAGPGDYVAGQLSVEAGHVTLDLIGSDGTHRRRLIDNAASTRDFRFVATTGGLLLRAHGDPGARFTIALTERLTPTEQVPPPPQYLSRRIAALAATVASGGTTDAFWESVAAEGTPMVELADGAAVVTFLVRGARRNARILGAPSGDHEWLARLGASDVWFKSFAVPASTRLAYKIAVDVPELPRDPRTRRVAILATARADPLNRHPWPQDAPDAYNQESILALPGAPLQPGLSDTPDAPEGTLTPLAFTSQRLGNSRELTLYRPAGFDSQRADNRLLILFDGEAYQSRVPTPRILDALIATGRIPPTAAVFVPSIDPATRSRELPANPAFADALADELLPLVTASLGAPIPPARTVVAGSSYGGLAAATAALSRPDAFGNVLAMSGSFWWHPADAPADQPHHVAARVLDEPHRTVRFHLSAGLFETAHGGSGGILETTRHLRDVLRAKSYPTTATEYAGGHDYLIWQGALADGLIALTANADK